MKKILVLTILLIAGSLAYADIIPTPEWSEFCPVEYINAKPSRWSKNTDYWYTRRTQFDASISRCSNYTGNDLRTCYEHIRTAEQNKNKVWQERLEQQRIENERSTEMYNRMQTINTINHLIDTIGK